MSGLNWRDNVVQDTVDAVRLWLGSNQDPHALLENLPVLELALAKDINNQERELESVGRSALERVNSSAALDTLSNSRLAALIRINLNAFAAAQEEHYADAAERVTKVATTRYDDTDGFFRADASDTSRVFYTDANAQLAEAFYLAWRALDEQTLRPIAGEVLSQVSARYDERAGLYQKAVLPDGEPGEAHSPGTYAAALHMFLTACETTNRLTYVSRAAIVANYGLQHLDLERGAIKGQVTFADALIRLEKVMPGFEYHRRGVEILSRAAAEPGSSLDEAAVLASAIAKMQVEQDYA